MSDQPDLSGTAEQAMAMIEHFAPLRELLSGYRASFIAQGFTGQVADACVIQLHGVFMAQAQSEITARVEIDTAERVAEIRRNSRR